MEQAIARITAMENTLNTAADAVEGLKRTLERLDALRPALEELFSYYGSPAWFDDRDRDSRGLLPSDLPRGVLTEDAVYDLMTDYHRLMDELRQLGQKELPWQQEDDNATHE